MEKFVLAVGNRLDNILSHANVDACVSGAQVDNPLQEGYSYAVKDGGKRIRPISVYLGALATGGAIGEKEYDDIVNLACVVELIHSYSLVHDDLPAMDNDDYRRGKLSVHKKYGEANGILIGDGLLTLAMKAALECEGDNYRRSALLIANGALNMVTGQAYDLQDGAKDYTIVYALKTADLISSAFGAGATYMAADSALVNSVANYGYHLGIAFQLADDILDDGTEVSLVTEKGRDYVKSKLEYHTNQAIAIAKTLSNSDLLEGFATKLLKRTK